MPIKTPSPLLTAICSAISIRELHQSFNYARASSPMNSPGSTRQYKKAVHPFRGHFRVNRQSVKMAEQERSFLKFLLQASTRQAKLLLDHLTPRQLAALGEVCHNLLHGELNPELKKDLKPYKSIIRQLADRQLNVKERQSLAVRKALSVVRVLRLVEDLLP